MEPWVHDELESSTFQTLHTGAFS